MRGSNAHVHPAKLGAAAAARITSAVKKQAAVEIFTSAAEIVNKVIYSFECLFFYFAWLEYSINRKGNNNLAG